MSLEEGRPGLEISDTRPSTNTRNPERGVVSKQANRASDIVPAPFHSTFVSTVQIPGALLRLVDVFLHAGELDLVVGTCV